MSNEGGGATVEGVDSGVAGVGVVPVDLSTVVPVAASPQQPSEQPPVEQQPVEQPHAEQPRPQQVPHPLLYHL